jgi:hypothetical protein
MRHPLLSSVLLFLFIGAGVGPPGARAQSAEALKQQIQARSQNLAEFRALLNDPDQTVRLAALDTMLKSDDIAMRELAYGTCFNSADAAMRGLCVKNRIADMQSIVIEIGDVDEPTENEQKTLDRWSGSYAFTIESFDEKTGQMKTAGSYKNGTGQVSGTGFDIAQPYCNGQFRLTDGGYLEGELRCTGNWAGRYPGRIRLQ